MALAKSLLGLELSPAQLEAFGVYERELMEWNSRFNLTAIRDAEGIRIKHFLDSLTCLEAVNPATPPENLIDVGSGAGFPGLPLKIVLPQLKLTLVESIQKKAGFCQHMVEVLGLTDVEVVSSRAEELGQDVRYRERYDVAVARAVAAMPTLVEYLLPFVRIGGLALMQKGANGADEAQTSSNAIRLMGGQVKQVLPVVLPGLDDQRFLVVLEKIKPTRAEFPRRTGLPTKQPIGK